MNSGEVRGLRLLLNNKIGHSSKVFIVGHNSPDFDSIGSAIGLYILAKSLHRDAYIIVDDDEFLIEPGVQRIIKDSVGRFPIIKKREFLDLVDKDSILLVTDVNKKHMISVGDCLDKFKDIIVIDHHSEDADTIDTPYRAISNNVSSASEIVTRVLWVSHLKYPKDVANYLLAGISLDTNRFQQNTSSRTHDVAEKLIDKGADVDYVKELFMEDYESFCRVGNLVINGTVVKKYTDSLLAPIQVSFTLNRNKPTSIYLKEDFAKAADQMMDFHGIDAAFALGHVYDGGVHISARGGKRVDVGQIMKEMSGGGNRQSAGAKIYDKDILDIEEELMSVIPIGISEEENILDEPHIVKRRVKKYKK